MVLNYSKLNFNVLSNFKTQLNFNFGVYVCLLVPFSLLRWQVWYIHRDCVVGPHIRFRLAWWMAYDVLCFW